MIWQTTRFQLIFERPLVMGIVNATPDSFSDGGLHAGASAACAHCERLLAEGADILDIGGESTRPDAVPPTAEEELARVLPVLRHAVTLGMPVSLDSSEPLVMRAALDLGVDILNDVRALRRPGALALLAGHPQAGACLMHLRGEPATMRAEAERGYANVVQEVQAFLAERIAACEAAGVQRQRLAIDPGYGFAKNASHNLALLGAQASLAHTLGVPLLAGLSRKTLLGQITDRPVGERVAASIAAAVVAVEQGACILRVHDVAATVDALKVWQAVRSGKLDSWPGLGARSPA